MATVEESVDIELFDLLSPITPAVFSSHYWCRKPLFIKGDSEKLHKIIPGGFGREDFHRAVREAAAKRIKGFRLWANRYKGLNPSDDGTSKEAVFIEPNRMEELFASGANIAADNILDKRVALFAAALKTQLNHPGDVSVTATLSPKGNGWPPHIDRTTALFIQCEGRKRFLFSPEPVAQWPRGNAMFASDGTAQSYEQDIEDWEEVDRIDLEDLVEVVMEPGDMLFAPPGTVHATEALSETTLNINLLFDHPNFLALISGVLEQMLISDPAWRHLPSVNWAEAKQGELTAETKRFFAARLGELRFALNALTPDDPELNRQWQKMVADPGEATAASLSIDPGESNRRPVQRKDVLQLSPRGPITYAVIPEDESFILYFANREISVEKEWTPFLKTMIEKRLFVAEDAIGWAGTGKRYPWKVAREYLGALLEQAILERVES